LSYTAYGLLWLTENGFLFVSKGHYLKHSKTVYFALSGLMSLADKKSRTARAAGQLEKEIYPFRFLKNNSLPQDVALDQQKQAYLNQYIGMVNYMFAISQAANLKFIYFLQPAPMVGKILTEEEKAFIKTADYQEDYKNLEARLLMLKSANIDVVSLVDVFKDFSTTAYKDHIHLDTTTNAPDLVNQAIIKSLVAHWGLEPSSN
jgi:hypothetical protein